MIKNNTFVIGVDGGGTKTLAALADMNGKIVKTAKAGCSNPRNVGNQAAADNIAESIFKILKSRAFRISNGEVLSKAKEKKNIKIISTVIGLPAMEEEFKGREQEIIRALKKHKEISTIFGGKVKIVSDQLVAFRSGSSGDDGISVIAGTGCAVHGWYRGVEAKANGWGWLADEGSGFWIGQKTFQTISKSLDGRIKDTTLADLAKKTFKLKNAADLVALIYKDPEIYVPQLAPLCRQADEAGDTNATAIMQGAGKEIALSVIDVYQRLGFAKQTPEIVIVGGIFNSQTVIESVKTELEKSIGPINIIKPELPVTGAVRLALE
jgi:N-acetylglucosamine kinase-like BadF-type ATPase